VSIRSQRTGRHEDDFPMRRQLGVATLGDAVEHAQEIIAETPEAFGQTTAEVVALLVRAVREWVPDDVLERPLREGAV